MFCLNVMPRREKDFYFAIEYLVPWLGAIAIDASIRVDDERREVNYYCLF